MRTHTHTQAGTTLHTHTERETTLHPLTHTRVQQEQLDLQIILMATTGYDNKRDTPCDVECCQGVGEEQEQRMGSRTGAGTAHTHKKFVLPAVI